jgi:hypothetical protein
MLRWKLIVLTLAGFLKENDSPDVYKGLRLRIYLHLLIKYHIDIITE